MQIVYRIKEGVYPFNRAKQTQNTYVQHLLTDIDYTTGQNYRDLARAYKAITCPHLFSMKRILKNENEIHFFYQYFPTSIETYLNKKTHSVVKRIQQELSCALKCLQNSLLKAQMRVQFIAVDEQGSLKLLVTPENLTNSHNLNDFYTTQMKRLIMQLEQIWEQNKAEDIQQTRVQKQPGFKISGNELIFNTEQTQGQGRSHSKDEQNLHKQPKQQVHYVHSAQMLLEYIEKQKQKAKILKHKHNQLKGHSIQHKPHCHQTQKQLRLIKKFSMKPDMQAMKQSHKSQVNHANRNIIESKLINSAAQMSNQNHNYFRSEDRPTNRLITQKETESNHNPLSYQDIRAIAIKHLESEGKQVKEEPKIQVTTQMVSKYKMKIVTCQQIEFQGKEGDDIEKIAQQKLMEYQQQHGLPTISIQNAHQNTSDETTNIKTNSSSEEVPDKNQKLKAEGHQSQQISTKIMKAKEKAEHVLKYYAKAKKK